MAEQTEAGAPVRPSTEKYGKEGPTDTGDTSVLLSNKKEFLIYLAKEEARELRNRAAEAVARASSQTRVFQRRHENTSIDE
ncbi:hypothetical protein KM043_014579 [Ampulex compressa]|nr:hypothetical protein KM043_014579 [Ampulex compressa]